MHKKQKPKSQARSLAKHLRVGGKPALDRLYLVAEAGYTTVQALKNATDEELLAISGIGSVAVAQLRALLESV